MEDISNLAKEIEGVINEREKIINYNNDSILETSIFYENFFLFHIIKKLFLKDEFENNKKMAKFISERMTFYDRYEIIKAFAKDNSIKIVSNNDFEFFIQMRNKIAHQLSEINGYDIINKELKVNFGGEVITWKEYLEKIERWTEISYKIAEFAKDVYHFINISELKKLIILKYCEFDKNSTIRKCSLLLEEPDGKLHVL